MWRRHHLVQSAVKQLPCRRGFGTASFPSAVAINACRSKGGGHELFYSRCVNKTSAAIFVSSHLQYWTPTIHRSDRTFDFSPQPSVSFSTQRRTGRKLPPRFSDDSTVDELVQIAHDNLDVMTPMATAALWNKISRQMNSRDERSNNRRGARRGDSGENARNINDIFQHTIDTLGAFSMKELTQTIFSMSKITSALQKQGNRRGEASHKRTLRELLLNNDRTPNEDVFRFFAGWSMDKLDEFDARHISNLAYSYALVRYVPEFVDGSNLFDHIAKSSVAVKAEFNDQDISNIVWAYATMNKPHAILFEAIGDRIVASKHLKEFKPQAFSNTVWAYSTVGINHPKLFETVANHIVESDHLDRFNPQNLANTVWAYATAGINHSKLFETVANHIVQSDLLDRFDPQNLANTVWAYATAGISHPILFEKMANYIVESDSLDQFKPQNLSNTVWAYATAGINHSKLFETVANHIVESHILNRFDPQTYSNTVWAYATAGISHPRLFELVANHIVESDSLDQFKPQNLSNTVWAYATAGINHSKLFETVANHIFESHILNRFDPQELSNTVWAYATAGINHPRLFELVANHIVQSDQLHRFNPQELSNIVWAYATSQVLHPKLFGEVAKAAIRRKDEFTSQCVANLLWAFASMGIIDKQLYSSFVPTATKFIDACSSQCIANIAWAYAVANVDASTLFNDHFINECVEKKVIFEVGELSQLFQWHLWQTKEKSNAGLPQDLLDKSYKVFISVDPTVSKLQGDVVAQLSSLDLQPKEEVLMDSGYRIDALVEVNGKIIVVEVDGPSHFIDKGRSPFGRTILKRRQVPAIDGIDLVSVPYWEWNKLGKSQTKKQQYLQKLLGLAEDSSIDST